MPKVKSNIKDLTKLVDVFSKEYENQLELLQKSYNAEIIQQFNEILKKIAEDYDLNYKDLQSKYVKDLKKNMKKTDKNINLIDSESNSDSYDDSNDIDKDVENLNLLEQITINDEIYYFEKKDGGVIYNKEVISVGEYKNGKHILF
tara:strand:+ start:284 stop:721 length:438 start_codon:yes stop_codon:yes gene_type:complete